MMWTLGRQEKERQEGKEREERQRQEGEGQEERKEGKKGQGR